MPATPPIHLGPNLALSKKFDYEPDYSSRTPESKYWARALLGAVTHARDTPNPPRTQFGLI